MRYSLCDCGLHLVAPRVGAWIEISSQYVFHSWIKVAPRVGAWIEIFIKDEGISIGKVVAPRVGAWIEMKYPQRLHSKEPSRTPCGCVD